MVDPLAVVESPLPVESSPVSAGAGAATGVAGVTPEAPVVPLVAAALGGAVALVPPVCGSSWPVETEVGLDAPPSGATGVAGAVRRSEAAGRVRCSRP